MPTTVGLIADTHLSSADEQLPPQVFRALHGVDLVLHAGDIYLPQALTQLATLAPVIAVEGNGDRHFRKFPQDRNPEHGLYRLEKYHLIEIEQVSVGIAHIFPLPEDEPYVDLRALADHCFGTWPRLVVCGDTHVPAVVELGGLTIINPGSPTFPGQIKRLGTVGILHVDGRDFTFEHIDLAVLD